MTNEKLLELWRGMPTPENWTMNDLIVQFGRAVWVQGVLDGTAPPDGEGIETDFDGYGLR